MDLPGRQTVEKLRHVYEPKSISPQGWLSPDLRNRLPPHPGFLKSLENWMGFRGLVPGIAGSWILGLRPDSPRSTHPPCRPEGAPPVVGFLRSASGDRTARSDQPIIRPTTSIIPCHQPHTRRFRNPTLIVTLTLPTNSSGLSLI